MRRAMEFFKFKKIGDYQCFITIFILQVTDCDPRITVQMQGQTAIVPVDGEEAVKDAKIIDAIYAAVKSGQKVTLKL